MLLALHGLKRVRYPFAEDPPQGQTAAMIRTECARMDERAGTDHRYPAHN